MTTAFFACAAAAIIAWQSSSVLNVNTPGRKLPVTSSAPVMGGTNGRLPVATISLSYGSTMPRSP